MDRDGSHAPQEKTGDDSKGLQCFKKSSDVSHQDHRPRAELIDLGTCGSHQDCQPSEVLASGDMK